MSKRVTISTIGAATPPSEPNFTIQQSVKKMADFWTEKLAQVWPDQSDLVVLPEMCDLYSDLPPAQMLEFCAASSEQMLELFRQSARQHKCYLAYPSLRCLQDGTRRNSLTMIDRGGEVMGIYDKNHVVISETTEAGVQCGTAAPLFECDFGSVAAAICFDLNFDELRLRYQQAEPDLILFVSVFHGGLMQAYWAYSCRAHFVSSIGFPGLRSGILSPAGETLASTTVYQDFVTATVNLDCCLAHLDFNRDKIKALKARYGRDVSIADPDLLGSVLISSETEAIGAREMAREFGIELLDDYMARSRHHHRQSRCR